MDIKEHTTPERLERYAFFWSLTRMVIAAFSLFFGAMPIVYKVAGFSSSIVNSLLPLFWLISGAASIYLLYFWWKAGMTVFGGSDMKDKVLFLVMAVTGLNLGYAAIGQNIGMGLFYSMPIGDLIFKVTAIVYLIVAYMLFKRWKESGETLFGNASAASVATEATPAPTPEPQAPAGDEGGSSDETPRPSL